MASESEQGITDMIYDSIVIGGGLSGLTAASLMAKRGLHVAVIDKSYNPGGSCGTFKRNNATFDQGSAMLYGFGDRGFNAHRFVFSCLEEPIDVIRHEHLYCVNFKGQRIIFYSDIERFTDALSRVFPAEAENIRKFYSDMLKMYMHVMVSRPSYSTADEIDPGSALSSLLRHPVSYIRFLSYLNKSAEDLLRKYFKDPGIFKFFDKLTSTYCYATVREAPAVLAAVMFVDNHFGGSYYIAGSTVFLPGKLEKVIEENGGDMFPEKEVVEIIFEDGRPSGVALQDGSCLYARNIVYSGTVWNLYGKLIDRSYQKPGRAEWAANQEPTYPSVVLYAHVDRRAIPDDTLPVEMLVGNPDHIDESEVTAYILSIDDRTLCDEESHVVVAIGPTAEKWDYNNKEVYAATKEKERVRLIAVMENRFPGFTEAVRYSEVATPCTIERYTNKNGGAVAGPKQMLGQHMLHRLHTRSEWDNLFCCGESTVMGTGTPTVTTSGLSAANAVLARCGLETFIYKPGMKNQVKERARPFTSDMLYSDYPDNVRDIMLQASRCQFCEHPTCSEGKNIDIRGIMRRVTVGNFIGAQKALKKTAGESPLDSGLAEACERDCVLHALGGRPVSIRIITGFLEQR
ncbi:MAG: FAD-dependent oxidoreductase [Saccharofermentanales bacterium]